MSCSILCLRFIAYHADSVVIIIKINATDAGRRSSERSRIGFIEPYATSVAACDEHLGLAVGKNRFEKFVALTYIDSIDTLGTRP